MPGVPYAWHADPSRQRIPVRKLRMGATNYKMNLVFTDIRTDLPLQLVEERIAAILGWEEGSFVAVLCTFADGKQCVCVDFPSDLDYSEASDLFNVNINDSTNKINQ